MVALWREGMAVARDEAVSLAFQQSLPAKRMGAGLLIRDEVGRPMLVEPVYKADWEIPGGAVEADESPRECVIREVREELGLVVVPGRLLVIDYQHPEPNRTESLMFIFDGGVLGDSERRGLRLADDELNSYVFVDPSELGSLTSERLARRVRHALDVASAAGLTYLENGRAPG